MWIGYEDGSAGAVLFPNVAGYDWSMIRGVILHWMIPELGDDTILLNC